MWSCDQSLVTLAFISEKYYFFEGWSWFKFNNLRLGPGMVLKFYTSVAKRLKLKVRKFWELTLTFAEVIGEKLVGGGGGGKKAPILNRVKLYNAGNFDVRCAIK